MHEIKFMGFCGAVTFTLYILRAIAKSNYNPLSRIWVN
jgi:hypothetical protein